METGSNGNRFLTRKQWAKVVAVIIIFGGIFLAGFICERLLFGSDEPAKATKTTETAKTLDAAPSDNSARTQSKARTEKGADASGKTGALTDREYKSLGFVKLTGHITRVSDGDTVNLKVPDGKSIRIRLLGIDAPELHMEPSGDESRKHLGNLLKACSRDVSVYYHEKNGIDQYERVIGKIVCGKNDVNLQMIRDGHAWFFKRYEKDVIASDRTLYADAEKSARKAKIGLWSESNPEAPWEWRKKNPR